MGFNPLAKIFLTTLYMTLQQVMGLNSSKETMLHFFGIKVMNMAFKVPNNFPNRFDS